MIAFSPWSTNLGEYIYHATAVVSSRMCMLRFFRKNILTELHEAWEANGRQGKAPKWGTKVFWNWSVKQNGPGKNKPYGAFAMLLKVALGLRNSCWEFIGNKFSGDEKVLISEYGWYSYDLHASCCNRRPP